METKTAVNVSRLVITLGALGFLALHLLRPDLGLDPTALGLIVLAALPWLSSLIKSAEVPGLGKVEFNQLEEAGGKVTRQAPPPPSPQSLPQPSYLQVADLDPNLALAGLRIEIEKRLRSLAQKHALPDRLSVGTILGDLEAKRAIDSTTATGLRDLLSAANRAVHGAAVDPRATAWALSSGPQVLSALDARLNSV